MHAASPPLLIGLTAESITRKRKAARQQWPVSQEFYSSLLARERTRTILPRNANVWRAAVSWLLETSATAKCSTATASLAVVYYGAFVEWAYERPGAASLGCASLVKWVLSTEMRWSSTYPEGTCHELLIFACILLAAKRIEPRCCTCFEHIEVEACYVQWVHLPNKKPDLDQSSCQFVERLHAMELLLLKALQWDTACLSAHDFFHYWMDRSMTIGEEDTASKLQEICYITINAGIREASFASLPARVLAAGAIIWALKALDLKLTTMQSSIHNCVIEDLGSTVAMIGHLWLEHQLSNRTSLILQENFVPDLQVSLPAAKTCQTSLKKRCTTNVHQNQQKKMKRICVNTGQKMSEQNCNKLLVSCLV